MITKPNLLLVPVKGNGEKIDYLTQISWNHFEKREYLLILAPDIAALKYIDDLLWKWPKESFLPHGTAQESIAITDTLANPNQAKIIFNLRPEPIFWENLKMIYEFEDLTSPEKKEIFNRKYHAYRDAGCPMRQLLD